jgi:hypothetical protein
MHRTYGERLDIVVMSFGHSVIDRFPTFTSVNALKDSRNIGPNVYNIRIFRMLQYSGNVPASAKLRTCPPVFDIGTVRIFGCK